MRRSHINTTGIPEREERLEAENFPKLMTENHSGSITNTVWLYNYIFNPWETKIHFSHLEGWDNPNQTGHLQWSDSLPERWMSTQPGNYWEISGGKKKSRETRGFPSFLWNTFPEETTWPHGASCSWRKPHLDSYSGRQLSLWETADQVRPVYCASVWPHVKRHWTSGLTFI